MFVCLYFIFNFVCKRNLFCYINKWLNEKWKVANLFLREFIRFVCMLSFIRQMATQLLINDFNIHVKLMVCGLCIFCLMFIFIINTCIPISFTR